VPDTSTQIAMIPVAWYTGTDFKQAPRYPAREITFIDEYAHTWASGPSDPPCLADGPGTVVEVDIKAKRPDVWELRGVPGRPLGRRRRGSGSRGEVHRVQQARRDRRVGRRVHR